MEVKETALAGVKIIKPDVFPDDRGFFFESYQRERYLQAGITAQFVQDNVSCSSRGVLRGLHWQAAPNTQAKLLSVIRGAVWDVVVDIRKDSPTFGEFVAETLSAENRLQLFAPRGFAHGFLVLEDETIFHYKCDHFYCKAMERNMKYDDPAINIPWPDLGIPFLLSEKDRNAPDLARIQPVEW